MKKDFHCLTYFVDGKCPKERYQTTNCPFNVVKKGYKYCCMAREGKQGGVSKSGEGIAR